MPKDKKPTQPPRMCKQTNMAEDKKGRVIYCNRWLDEQGRCPVHGKQ